MQFNETKLKEDKKEFNDHETLRANMLSNQTSEADFQNKVQLEKKQTMRPEEEQQETVSHDKQSNKDDDADSQNLFAGMMNVDRVLEEKKKKVAEKQRKLVEMK